MECKIIERKKNSTGKNATMTALDEKQLRDLEFGVSLGKYGEIMKN